MRVRTWLLWLPALLLTAPALGQPSRPDAGVQPSPRVFNGIAEDHILEVIRTAAIVSRQSVGSTSVNLHLHLAGEIDAAFKPRSTTHGDRYRAEIAAYRLNRLLGLTRVPPAITRSIARSQIRPAQDTTVLFDRDLHTRGAAIYWVPVLRDSLIDSPREIERWSRWLRQGGTLPPDQAVRAEEISTLLVFDCLTGNWDRWSGSNVAMDTSGHLIYRDNNGGFEEPFAESMMRRSMSWLRRSQRFSRRVIDRARGLTEASVRAEMNLDGDRDRPPLSAAQTRTLLLRRDAMIEYIDGLVARHGAAAVYAFE